MLRLDDRLVPCRDVRQRRGACLQEIRVAHSAGLESLGVAESSASAREPASAERKDAPLASPRQMDLTQKIARRLEFLMESWTPGAEAEQLELQRSPVSLRRDASE